MSELCVHPVDQRRECVCGECLSCPIGSRSTICGVCETRGTFCEECDGEFIPDEDETVCDECQQFAIQEYRNEFPENWGVAYINKKGGWER